MPRSAASKVVSLLVFQLCGCRISSSPSSHFPQSSGGLSSATGKSQLVFWGQVLAWLGSVMWKALSAILLLPCSAARPWMAGSWEASAQLGNSFL